MKYAIHTVRILLGLAFVVFGTNIFLNFIPAYTLANARITWTNEKGDLDISVEAQNLFDKYYLLTIFDLRGAGAG